MTVPSAPTQEITTKQRLMLFVLLGAGFMLSVDFSIMTVALPRLGAGVGLSLASLPWVAAAYALPAAGFTLLFGRLADLFGRRRQFMAGMFLLIGAALLLSARALQGLATALVAPAALSLLTSTFRDGPIRARILGINGALLSAGFTVGTLIGGVLVGLLSWRAAFFINVPVAVVILLLTPSLVTGSKVRERPKFDLPGSVTVTIGLLAAVYAIIEKNVIAAVIGVLLLAAFWVIERRSSAPIAPPRVLKRPTVTWGNYAGVVVFSMETAMIF